MILIMFLFVYTIILVFNEIFVYPLPSWNYGLAPIAKEVFQLSVSCGNFQISVQVQRNERMKSKTLWLN